MSFEQYSRRGTADGLSEGRARLLMDGMVPLAWLLALGGGADGVAQFRRRVTSYDVMVPAKKFGTLGAIAIN